jgi:hypothetical protein
MKEDKGKLSLTLSPVDSIRDAYVLLDRMLVFEKTVA